MRAPILPGHTSSPIGVFDSGWGGLSVWRSLTAALPNESTLYVGDHRYMPYGNLEEHAIRNRAIKIIRFLKGHGAKLIVIACNTATVAGIDEYRKIYPGLPIIGVVPVIKTAAEYTKTKKFVVLSTDFTAKSAYQRKLTDEFAGGCTVYMVGNAHLVPLIEAGEIAGKRIEKELHRALDPYLPRGIDIVALGCTHFPFVEVTIRAIVGDAVAVLDSGDAVARHTKRVLGAIHRRSHTGRKPVYTFYTTGDARRGKVVAQKLIGKRIHVRHVRL